MITIKKKYIPIRLMMSLLLLVLYKFFFLPENYESILVKYNTEGTYLFVSILVILFLLMVNMNRFQRWKKGCFGDYCVALLVYFFIGLVYSIIWYPELNVTRSISAYSFFLLLPLYYLLKIFFNRYDGLNFFIKMLTICNILMCVLMILSVYSINSGMQPIQHFYNVEFGTNYARNGMVRIFSGSGLIMTSFVLSTIFTFSKKNMWLHFANMGLSVWQTIYVTQTRMSLVVMLVVAMTAVISRDMKYKRMKQAVLFVFATIVVILVVQEMNFSSEETSYLTRLSSVTYFTYLGLTNLFGCGFLTDSDFSYLSILHGPSLTAYASDVGIIGVFGNLGVIPVLWYFMFVWKIYRTNINHIARPVLSAYFLVSMLTLVPLGYNTMPIIPISMAFVEYIYREQAMNL